ncbi:glycoside hydrolase family 172 protein [Amycolatopsis granulosa]|uniref:glycoside hydrolase family 172 protein n=1 Tax=Amycolatopsis granulosa TaxID=185684 RepID=UPI001FB90A10|nr:glycoside hydrolase family 172 protein [Amycolatopsis granulosa]NIH84886.1 hypothetical protein [Amycolatopsis granulosa]
MRKKRSLLVVAGLVLALAAGVPAQAAPAPAAPGKGPVGWDVYRSLDGLARLRPGEQVKQFSSFDRTGHNDDGFDGTYSCLRHEANGDCLLADARGAGEISSIWFTYAATSVADIGRITIELDGRVVLQRSLQDVVNGAQGAPFVWPLVGNSADTMGGSVIKVPMPYTSSMRITTEHNPHFYHVTYRQFADAAGVRTFDPADRATDVIQRLRAFGVRDPKPAAPGARTQGTSFDVPAGTAASIPLPSGAQRITQLRLRLPQVIAAPGLSDDGRAYGPGGSAFTASVAPDNDGVRITRRIDAGIGEQRADLVIGGRTAGQFSSGPARVGGGWLDETIEVPAGLTRGRSQLPVATRFVSSSQDVNEFRYEVHSLVGGQWVRTDVLDVGPNHPDEEAAHGYTVDGQQWAGLRHFRYAADPGQVAAADAVLEGLRLRLTFDGRTTVDAPVGEFFGSGLGKYASRTLLHSIDTTDNGAYTAWWPMPYARSAVVELVNTSGVPVTGGSLEVTTAPDAGVAAGLRNGSVGYFHATQHRAHTVPGQDWNFLTSQGRGVFYGVTTTMRGDIPPGQNQLSFLEGDERMYPDGSASPAMYGTGSEDFYESGWYFLDGRDGDVEGVPYAMPQAGLVSREDAGDGCRYVCVNAYRLMLGDGAAFGNGIEFDIEHGDRSSTPAEYSSTAYWYGQDTPSLSRTDVVETGDDASRSAHGYSAPGETRASLTSTFEGKGDTTPVTRTTTSTTQPVTFTARVDQENGGLRLHRVSDQAQAFQDARVFVNDRLVGEWYQALGNTYSRWLEDSFDIPAPATAGQTSVQVRLEPVSGAPAWSASRYTVFSQAAPSPAQD